MPRIRAIKPETPQDRKLASVSRDARLTFIFSWCIADDDGLFRAEDAHLKAELYPYDSDMSPEALASVSRELLDVGVWRERWTRDGCRVFEITAFDRHQRIDHRSKPFLAEQLLAVGELPADLAQRDLGISGETREPLAKPSAPEPRAQSLEPRVPTTTTGAKLERARAALAQPREKATRSKALGQAMDNAAEWVHSYFIAAWGKTGRYILNNGRRKRVVRLIKEGFEGAKAMGETDRMALAEAVSEICYAIDGAKRDRNIMEHGQFQTVDTILRDRGTVEKYRDLIPRRETVHPTVAEEIGANGAEAR